MKTSVLDISYGKLCGAVVAEFLATFILIFFGCMSCIPVQLNANTVSFTILFGSLGFGLAAMFSIQSFGHISGSLMNPAVVIVVVLWKKMPAKLGVAYIIAQCAGAIAGYGLLTKLTPFDIATHGICVTAPQNITKWQALGVETMLSMVISFINCSVLDPINARNTDSTALKIGLSISGLALAGSALTGGGMNPVRSLGPAVWANKWDAHWVYWVGPLLGGVVPAVIYKYIWLQPVPAEDINIPA